LLWPDSSDQNARKNLRQALWRLRKAIGDHYLLIDSNSLAFNSSSDHWLDIAQLEDEAEQDLESIVSVYEGELLPGFYNDWVLLERDRLAASFERKMHRLLNQFLQEKRWMEVLEWAERWIAQGLAPEAAYRALMRAHAAMGELSKVEVAYQRCTKSLQHDLGVDPSEETKRLYRQLLASEKISTAHIAERVLEMSATESGLGLLPAQVTAFIGRVKELVEIKDLLSGTRLISITGPGGIGKTRLAIKAAEEMANAFTHGCFFVSLAPIREGDYVTQAISEALNFPLATHEDPKVQLFRYLKHRQLLLVMDNFEHLLDTAEILNEVLQAAHEVKILATSREKLNLQGETNLIIDGLEFPKLVDTEAMESFDAISLFIQSAGRARPDFSPTAPELKQISRICQTVGGMPLAIELAAAWLHVLSVSDVVVELEKGFDLLETDKRDAPERHRSIRTVFNQSWLLLDQAEKDVFTKLSIFRGGFTREAAEQVAGATLHHLAGLVNKSFLSHDPSSGRFELHELLRQFAEEQLEHEGDARDPLMETFTAYYANFMQEMAIHLRGKKHKIVIDEILADIENVRAAWRFFLSQRNTPMLWKLITGLWHVYWIRWWNHAGMELFEEAVTALRDAEDEESLKLRGLAMALQSYFMGWVGIPEAGYQLALESVDLLNQFNQTEALVFAYDSVALNAYFLGRMSKEREAIDKMLEVVADLDDKWLHAFTLFGAGMITLIEGNYDEARRLAETNLKLYEELGDVSGSSMPLIILGHVALVGDEYEQARNFYLRCLEKAEQVDFYYSIQTASKYLGNLSVSTGDLEEAEDYLRKSLRITSEIGFVRDIINLIYEFARLRVEQGRIEQAVEMLSMVIRHPSSDQTRWLEGSIRESAKELLARLESEIPPDTLSSATNRGQTFELDHVVAALLSNDKEAQKDTH
jgi:predicted ATPase/DNA-binding SARP family transcriptional activator